MPSTVIKIVMKIVMKDRSLRSDGKGEVYVVEHGVGSH